MNRWPFDQPPKANAITTRPVLDDGETVRVVVHFEDDGSWAFLCGTTEDVKDGRVMMMEQAMLLDISLMELSDLPPGWTARRAGLGAPWSRSRS
jgi:hypothetical protein